MQATLEFVLPAKFQNHSFHHLLDKAGSFERMKKALVKYHRDWRAKRKVNHGGITSAHREMVWALLKILPATMEHFKLKRPKRFAALVKAGKYVIRTTRPSIAKVMAEEALSVGDRTISNLLNRLIDAGIIMYKKSFRGGIELEMNSELIELYKTQEELAEEPTEGEMAPSDSPSENPEKTENQTPKTLFGINLQPYTINKKDTNKKNNNRKSGVEQVQHPANSKRGRQSGACRIAKLSDEDLLLDQFLKTCYAGGYRLSEENRRAALQAIGEHLRAAEDSVRDWRGQCIRKVQETDKFKRSKNQEKFLSYFRKNLPDIKKRGFEMVAAAIQIQAEYIQKIGYDFKMNPLKYFNSRFFKPMEYAKTQMLQNFNSPVENTVYLSHIKARTALWRAVGAVSQAYKKEGPRWSLEVYANQCTRLKNLLAQDELLTQDQKFAYFNRLKNQLKHLFDGI